MLPDDGQSPEALHEHIITRYLVAQRAYQAGERVNHAEFLLLCLQVQSIQARVAQVAATGAQATGNGIVSAA